MIIGTVCTRHPLCSIFLRRDRLNLTQHSGAWAMPQKRLKSHVTCLLRRHLHRVFACYAGKQALHLPFGIARFSVWKGVERGCFYPEPMGRSSALRVSQPLPPTINSCIFYAQPLSKTSPFCQTVIPQKNDTSSQTGFQPAPA